MPDLFGRPLTRRDIAASAGSISAFGGVRLLTLGDGAERGVRMLEFRTGSGLRKRLQSPAPCASARSRWRRSSEGSTASCALSALRRPSRVRAA